VAEETKNGDPVPLTSLLSLQYAKKSKKTFPLKFLVGKLPQAEKQLVKNET
jgi:hypothetical protein